jgi:hypothetical protein
MRRLREIVVRRLRKRSTSVPNPSRRSRCETKQSIILHFRRRSAVLRVRVVTSRRAGGKPRSRAPRLRRDSRPFRSSLAPLSLRFGSVGRRHARRSKPRHGQDGRLRKAGQNRGRALCPHPFGDPVRERDEIEACLLIGDADDLGPEVLCLSCIEGSGELRTSGGGVIDNGREPRVAASRPSRAAPSVTCTSSASGNRHSWAPIPTVSSSG